MLTPVPPDFKVTWSHSSLNSFGTCPRKYWAEKILKCAALPPHPTTEWGLKVHKAMEDHIGQGVPLSSEFSGYQTTADEVASIARKAASYHCEKQLAVTRDWDKCEWFGEDAYGRAVIDFLALFPAQQRAVVVDYKLGKYRGHTTQPLVNAALIFAHYHHIDRVDTRFMYMAAGRTESETFTRDTLDEKFDAVQSVIDQLNTAVENQNFRAIPNGLCRQYCAHFDCPNNGRYDR